MKHRFAFLLAEFLYLRLETITTHIEQSFKDSNDEAFLFVGKPVNSPHESQRNENIVFNLAKSTQFDGILTFRNTLTPYHGQSKLDHYLKDFDNTKIVSIGEQSDNYSSVCLDNYHSIQLTINHLLEHDLKRFMYIGGPLTNQDAKDRLNGLQDFLKQHHIQLLDSFEGDFSYEFGFKVVNEMCQNNQVLPEAFICANDEMAIGAYSALIAHQIKVPEEVKLVGFDDNEKGRHIEVPLTTINQGFINMVDSGLDVIRKGHFENLVLPGELIIRESCGCTSLIKAASEEYFEKKVYIEKYQQLHQTLMDNLELQAQLSYTNDLNQLGIQLKRLLAHYHDFEFHICLIDKSSNSIGNPLEFTFPKRMNCFLSLIDGQFYENTEFNTSDILPYTIKEKTSTRVFYVYPLRVEDVSFGYIVCNTATAKDRRFVSLKDLLNISLNRIKMQREIESYKLELENLSYKDSLTRSYNHRGFHYYSEPHFKESISLGLKPALLYGDVDYLKLINDTYGHASGDIIIVAASDLLHQVFQNDIVARIGGDEFIVFIKDFSFNDQVSLDETLSEMMKQKNDELNQDFNFKMSFGLCVYDSSKHQHLEEMIREADNLLYERRKSSNHYDMKPKISR
jgi:diguanylate cyclase (GGDEF)-like protein